MHRRITGLTALLVALPLTAAWAGTYDLTIGKTQTDVTGKPKTVLTINGTVPGPTLHFKEGEEVTINVTNTLDVDTSLHWHGLVLPYRQDGVPGISFDGIEPGETFTYRFPIRQSGTYWFHSHTGFQEQEGMYGSIVIDPKTPENFSYDRDYVVVLSDMHNDSGQTILHNLKKSSDYYNRDQRTVGDFLSDIRQDGLGATLRDRADWGDMRMMPTDIADVSGYTLLINGRNADQNWTGLFKPGERIRLRFINASAMTYFDVRIPGLKMQVVQADGNEVDPVAVDAFRIAVAETYDVIVEPKDKRAYTVFAEAMSRSGYARATLAPRKGMEAAIPPMSPRPQLTMADMGMAHRGMDHDAMGRVMDSDAMAHDGQPGAMQPKAGMDHAAMGHAMPGHDMPDTDKPSDPFYAPGSGLTPKAPNGGKFLSYDDLKAARPLYEDRPSTREIELRLTGNMERYFWSINGVKYSDAKPIRLRYGERVRFKFVNETMMTHPMHLHGMWSILDTGKGRWDPIKHVVSIAPGKTVYTETEVDAPGEWAFHCHLMYHMGTGMFRKIIVEGGPSQQAALRTKENEE
ncbi:L-ascorbate oxidase [Parvibaculum indicum]|uniref:copper resistance system multicopper oxidase n=1 Tax=Parvibaculum indicum TaxID=562969 RepID=UPI001421B872|nr:copper resistance system multicopper oxidase [Parvibaculum indicum]NIJ40709.1 L-ascorbate oxidase [Parvibaculum indicum]